MGVLKVPVGKGSQLLQARRRVNGLRRFEALRSDVWERSKVLLSQVLRAKRFALPLVMAG